MNNVDMAALAALVTKVFELANRKDYLEHKLVGQVARMRRKYEN